MMRQGEIVQQFIDDLIQYLDDIKNNISSIDELLKKSNDEVEKVCLSNMRMVYTKVFDDISLKLKNTIEKLFKT